MNKVDADYEEYDDMDAEEEPIAKRRNKTKKPKGKK